MVVNAFDRRRFNLGSRSLHVPKQKENQKPKVNASRSVVSPSKSPKRDLVPSSPRVLEQKPKVITITSPNTRSVKRELDLSSPRISEQEENSNVTDRSIRRDLNLCSLMVSQQLQIPSVDITTTTPTASSGKIVYNTVDGCVYYSHLLLGTGYIWVKLVAGAPVSSERGFGVFRQSAAVTVNVTPVTVGDPWTTGTVHLTAMSAVRTASTTLASPSTVRVDKDGSYSITWTASAAWEGVGGAIPLGTTFEFGVGINGSLPTEAMVTATSRFGIAGPAMELTGTTQLDLTDGDVLTFYYRKTVGTATPFAVIHLDAQELRVTRESP
uniref:Uncharacterized protein n=1 Tax=Marseillevirus LCMAC101 TaxID=2506602 RepID=A0A481YU30_9VIRU|nr:MAG: hypothetical protein LCMAC101_06010 [Marseillevirus LCMAC101]